jgi:transcriptional regulator with XRE-family HTH domain
VLTETPPVAHARTTAALHPICAMLRQLRVAAGLSLTEFESRYEIPAVVVGAYERGDRTPPLHKLDTILGAYGYRLQAVPTGAAAVRLPEDIIGALRAIADQLEAAQLMPAAA